MLLVDMNRKLPTMGIRIWPARFVQQPSAVHDGGGDGDEGSAEFNASYLIGLDWRGSLAAAATSPGETSDFEQPLQAVLGNFETRIHLDNRYYDASCCWMMASIVDAREVGAMRPDSAEWAGDGAGETDSEGEEEERDEDEGADGSQPAGEEGEGEGAATASSKPAREQRGNQGPRQAGGRFRTAADVINRLRWDRTMDAGDYVVGYRDRFAGVRERALDEWTGEQTHDDFIPQHRIVHFKRRSDGVVVWERETRLDRVFGSGP
ncbi:hypothetical protein CDD83_9932 [Cordyceps sp. RAO-2017]|nr:hypothetical protein CDD83_9932 [Cordyceps sp. RAO-2017]